MKTGLGEEGILGCRPGRHPEKEAWIQELCWGLFCAPVKERRSKTGQRELGCGAIPTEASGAPVRTSRVGMMQQRGPSSSKGAGLLYEILHEPVLDEGCSRKGGYNVWWYRCHQHKAVSQEELGLSCELSDANVPGPWMMRASSWSGSLVSHHASVAEFEFFHCTLWNLDKRQCLHSTAWICFDCLVWSAVLRHPALPLTCLPLSLCLSVFLCYGLMWRDHKRRG